MKPPAWLRRGLLRVPAYVWAGVLLLVLLLGLGHATRLGTVASAWKISQADVVLAQHSWDQARTVALPHEWDSVQRRWDDEAHYQLHWPAALPNQPDFQARGLGLLIPRAGVRFKVLFNGEWVARETWRDPDTGYFDASVQTHMVLLPPGLLAADWADNRLEIHIKGQALRISGLSAVWLGPADTLWKHHQWLTWWQVNLTWMVTAAALMLGLLSVLVWMPSGERLYGFLGASLLMLALRLWLSTPAYLPGPFAAWDYVHKLTFTWYCGFNFLFLAELFRFQPSRVRTAVWFMMGIAPFWFGLLFWSQNYQFNRVWNGLILLLCVVSLLREIHRARWGANAQQRLMVVVCLATLITGVRDFWVVQMGGLGVMGDADIRWMTPGSLMLMFAMGSVMLQRINTSLASTEQRGQELAEQLSQREQALHNVYVQLRSAENQRVLEAERRRLTRDMHDGLGSQLVQTLNLVRSSGPVLDSAIVATLLTQALAELRMTLDSLEPMEGDLPAILGTVRQRIGPTLQAARIELDWQVQEVPGIAHLNAQGVMHLFRCLQEVFANIVKHAHATRVCVSTWVAEGAVHLSVCDNGSGFAGPPDAAFASGGRGLHNLRLRAAAMGATLSITAARPGTCVTFRFAAHAPTTVSGSEV